MEREEEGKENRRGKRPSPDIELAMGMVLDPAMEHMCTMYGVWCCVDSHFSCTKRTHTHVLT